jgi:transcriptional regulator with XRE-family HTH domain
MTRMKDRRLQLGMSQTVLAARARPMSTSDVSRIENKRQVPYPGQLKRLARALKLAPDELLLDVEPPSAATRTA